MNKVLIAWLVSLPIQATGALLWAGSMDSTVKAHVAEDGHPYLLDRVARAETAAEDGKEQRQRIEDKLDRLIRDLTRRGG